MKSSKRVRYKAWAGSSKNAKSRAIGSRRKSNGIKWPKIEIHSDPMKQVQITMDEIKELVPDYDERISDMTEDQKAFFDQGLKEKFYQLFGNH